MNINITTSSNVDGSTQELLHRIGEHLREGVVQLTALNETLSHYLTLLTPPQGTIDEAPQHTQAFDPDATMRVRRPG